MPPYRFDAHCHIFDPHFALQAACDPLPTSFTCDDYRARVTPLGFTGGAVVATPAQGWRQGHLLDALRRLGPGYVGVARLPLNVGNSELDTLNGFGVRGLRLTLKRGASVAPEQCLALARRVHQHTGWHAEVALDPRELADFEESLAQLPALCLDLRVLARGCLPSLLRLVERGARIKLFGIGRLNASCTALLDDLYSANPQALMFGSGLPSADSTTAAVQRDLDTLSEVLGEAALPRLLWHNAAQLYRVQPF